MGVFDVLGATRETAHTKLLAWLLDPNEDHGLGSLLSRAFCSGTVGQHVSLRGAVVRSEMTLAAKYLPSFLVRGCSAPAGNTPLSSQLVLDGCATKHMQPASVGV